MVKRSPADTAYTALHLNETQYTANTEKLLTVMTSVMLGMIKNDKSVVPSTHLSFCWWYNQWKLETMKQHSNNSDYQLLIFQMITLNISMPALAFPFQLINRYRVQHAGELPYDRCSKINKNLQQTFSVCMWNIAVQNERWKRCMQRTKIARLKWTPSACAHLLL